MKLTFTLSWNVKSGIPNTNVSLVSAASTVISSPGIIPSVSRTCKNKMLYYTILTIKNNKIIINIAATLAWSCLLQFSVSRGSVELHNSNFSTVLCYILFPTEFWLFCNLKIKHKFWHSKFLYASHNSILYLLPQISFSCNSLKIILGIFLSMACRRFASCVDIVTVPDPFVRIL